jgi:hypothetical protein
MRLLLRLILLALLAGSMAAPISANPPDPRESFFEDCLGRSPNNDIADPTAQYTFSGILNDASGIPVQGYSDVVIEIFPPCAHPVVLPIAAPSDAGGLVVWTAEILTQGGGACDERDVVEIRVGGEIFDTLDDVKSPDIDGDTFVALADLRLWQQAFRDQSPLHIGDLDCDGFIIAINDLLVWQKHFTAQP